MKLQSHYAGLLNIYDGGTRIVFQNAAEWLNRLQVIGMDLASEMVEPPYRVRTFWSPDREYLVNACCSESDITLLDDDGNIWEPTGPEEDVAHPDYLKRTASRTGAP